jgi:hypothetical protein
VDALIGNGMGADLRALAAAQRAWNPKKPEMRKEPRYRTSGKADITVIMPSQSAHVSARVRDVSKSGLVIVIPTFVSPSANVKVELRSLTIYGTVQWCNRTSDNEFGAGIAIASIGKAA